MNRQRQTDTQNMIIAMLLSILVLVYWNYFVEAPRQQAQVAAMKTRAQARVQTEIKDEKNHEIVIRPRDEILKDSARVTVTSQSLNGSIALKGLRIDDLTLSHYRETLDAQSPAVTLLSPADAGDGYFAEFGWSGISQGMNLPTAETVWTPDRQQLTPQTPVTLTWKNPEGALFTVRIALDDKYLFTLTQKAVNASGQPLILQTYAFVNRVYDIKKHPPLGILHEGPLGVLNSTLKEAPYKKLREEKDEPFEANAGWLGITDKYWLAALIPPQEAFTSHFSYYDSRGRDHYQADYVGAASPETTLHFFAGAKELTLLDAYAKEYHIPLFERAIDFGFFYWLAEPLFRLLIWFHALVGNFGIAILLLTVLVKAVMYPLASKSFVSMNRMKVLQPKMKEIQERHKADKMQMNQAIMELYKREKVNPASGCLPVFIQIPVFFSLYKVLYVTIEMRHAPFFGWIHDLSETDPTNVFTLFGLLPWHAPALLHLGIWPMLMCLTMIVQQRQSPPPTDPTQAKMMKFLPFFFLFLFSNVAAGLVIYWTWSNTLSILQQWFIKRRHGEKKA